MKVSMTFIWLSTLLVVFLCPPTTPTQTQAMLCAGSGGLVVGLGLGLGVGYLAFGYFWRNSGGVWLGKGGAGFWLPRGRKRRDIWENIRDFDDWE